jgi:hypothetical protein
MGRPNAQSRNIAPLAGRWHRPSAGAARCRAPQPWPQAPRGPLRHSAGRMPAHTSAAAGPARRSRPARYNALTAATRSARPCFASANSMPVFGFV